MRRKKIVTHSGRTFDTKITIEINTIPGMKTRDEAEDAIDQITSKIMVAFAENLPISTLKVR